MMAVVAPLIAGRAMWPAMPREAHTNTAIIVAETPGISVKKGIIDATIKPEIFVQYVGHAIVGAGPVLLKQVEPVMPRWKGAHAFIYDGFMRRAATGAISQYHASGLEGSVEHISIL